jgi:hypothetical protein
MRADDGRVEHLHEEASASKKVSNTPLRLKRQKRFQMLWSRTRPAALAT